MSKYKIHIDPTLPDSKKIQGHKDFDALYDHYQVNTRLNFWRNLYRKPTNFAILVLILAVGALVFDASKDEDAVEIDYFLKAPTKGALPGSKTLEMDVDQETSINEANWKLTVPRGAWTDTLGNKIDGLVEVSYRWLPRAEDWLKRGIPMQDEKAIYASGGILEVFATQEGKPLQLLPGKPLRLSVSYQQEDKLFYPMQLDTLSRSWNYIKDTSWVQVWDSSALTSPKSKPVIDSSGIDLVAKAAEKRLKKPSKPFGVEVENKNQYPYFKDYEKVYWEYVDLPGSANPWKENLLGKENGWNKVKIRQTSDQQFTLTFSKVLPSGTVVRKRVIAKPLFKASNRQEAEAIYQQRLQAYREELAKIDQERAMALAQRKREFESSLQAWDTLQYASPKLLEKRCIISLRELGFVGLMNEAATENILGAPWKDGTQRLWWSDTSGEKLVEIDDSKEHRLPKADSIVWYRLVDGHLTKN